MTVIIGYTPGDGSVWMGADGIATDWDGYDVHHITDHKIVRKATNWGDLLVGVCGGITHLRVLQAFDSRVPGTPRGMVAALAKYLWTQWHEDWDLYRGASTEVKRVGAQFVVGWQGELHVIDTDGTVGQFTDSYICVGSGEDPARGAMHALTKGTDLGPMAVLIGALEATAHHKARIQPPFLVETIPAG